jgi:PII-like signaling protein
VGPLITLTVEEVYASIKSFWGGKAVSADAIQDISPSYPIVLEYVDAEILS